MRAIPYPIAIFGSVAVLVLGWIIISVGHKFNDSRARTPKDQYRRDRLLSTVVVVAGAIVIFALWARLFQHTSTFLGIIGAGLAVALREPLLSIAGRVAIFVGHMYTAGDRIEINKMSGDVIDVGFFYTRMMEIGNWISGDQYSGRIIQFANAQIFGSSVFNYTRNFDYIWDEAKLPITYQSNTKAATEILKQVGGEYTKEFMQNAEAQIEKMQRIFMVPRIEVEPLVYLKVTDNWIELVMRYLVAPKKRRAASSYIYDEVFRQIQQRDDIEIASSTMTVTVQKPKVEAAPETQQEKEEDQQPRKAA
ncbi:MAG TPA: mechanosensitive ion channel family protein [Candidatus Limnocylindrales bacterium]|nr:mechanosensitive ion channel family protein [Candidatus Limnocylindrales bacterium]